jgi:CheY-like chemotaxis protein
VRQILLADDHDALRLLVSTTLEDGGWEIVEARDGLETIELARKLRPAALILDWMMPGKSGPDVVRTLRQDPDFRDTPIILLTARSLPEDRQEGIDAGANAFVTKPFSPIALIALVERLLGEGDASGL